MATDTRHQGIDLVEMTKRIRHDIATPIAIVGQSAYYIRNRIAAGPSPDAKAGSHAADIESAIRAAAVTLKAIVPELKLYAAVSKALELDSSLAAIKASLAGLKARVESKPPVEEKVAKHLRIIASELVRGDGMLRDVEACFKLKTLSLKPADLDAFLEETLSGQAFPPEVKLKKDLRSKAKVQMDGPRLRTAVGNLLKNCFDAMASGGTVTVTSFAEKGPAPLGQAVIEVADTGPGFSPEAAAKVFTPFFTTTQGKLGLGLASAQAIMKLHKGSVEARKSPGGALVRLVLSAI